MDNSDSEDEKRVEDDGEYERQSDNEDFEDYKIDGYHPAFLGEKLKDGDYQIIQKLGWGHFSTVWLAQKSNGQYCALKIQKSKKSYQESAVDELELLQDLMKNKNNEKWASLVFEINLASFGRTNLQLEDNFCVNLQDNFIHHGMHGKHYCSTFEIMGPNLLDLITHFEDADEYMDLKVVKAITKQMLIGLVYMHDVCGIIHTDLKPENVMINLRDDQIQDYIEKLKVYKKKPISMKFIKSQQQSGDTQKNKKKYDKKKAKKAKKKQQEKALQDQSNPENQQENQPDKANVSTQDNTSVSTDVTSQSQQNTQKVEEKKKEEKPKKLDEEGEKENEEGWDDVSEREELYTLIWKGDISISIDEMIQVKLVDFGNACWENRHFTDTIQTREYRAPEGIIKGDYFANTDMWSLACMVFEMIVNNFLFKPKRGEGYKKNDDHLALMCETLGKIPKNFALSGKRSREFFNKNGVLIRIKDLGERSISKLLQKKYKYNEKDSDEIEEFLKPMLEFDPKRRISASEALKSKWLWT